MRCGKLPHELLAITRKIVGNISVLIDRNDSDHHVQQLYKVTHDYESLSLHPYLRRNPRNTSNE